MKLTELDPRWLRTVPGKRGHMDRVDHLEEAQGIVFLCPKCFQENGGPVGTHSVIIWFEGRDVPTEEHPLPRWSVHQGADEHDVTIKPSIWLKDGCGWHGFITNGEIETV